MPDMLHSRAPKTITGDEHNRFANKRGACDNPRMREPKLSQIAIGAHGMHDNDAVPTCAGIPDKGAASEGVLFTNVKVWPKRRAFGMVPTYTVYHDQAVQRTDYTLRFSFDNVKPVMACTQVGTTRSHACQLKFTVG